MCCANFKVLKLFKVFVVDVIFQLQLSNHQFPDICLFELFICFDLKNSLLKCAQEF